MRNIFTIFMVLFVCTNIWAQGVTIKGRVTDAKDGSAIISANVLIKGTTKGTMTDLDGNYQIDVPSANSTLIFSFIGYNKQEVTLKSNQKVLNISMQEDSKVLDDVVVIGYGTTKKALVTGANLQVKGSAIMDKKTGNAMEALQGIAPGVNITRNSGAPGAGTKVTIRGLGTIGNSSPLYIVDGVAVGNIDYLSSSDIESIDVLKDAASAAIYGSRAANGVVLVTTRKGKFVNAPDGKTKATVNYDGYYGVQNIYKNVSPLNAQEYMYIMDEGFTNDGLKPHDWHAELTNNAWLNTTYPNKLGTRLGDDIWDRLQSGWKGTNWIDEMTKKDAPIQNHSVNISGASNSGSYSLGFSYFDQSSMIGGNIIDAGFKRYTARMNTDFILFKTDTHNLVTIGENLTYTNTQNRSVATGNIYYNDLHNAIVQNPLMPVYWDKSPDKFKYTPTLEGLANDQHNPVATMFYRSNYNWSKSNSIIGNVFAEIQPIEKLVIRSVFGANVWFGHSRGWTPTYALATLYGSAIDGASMGMYQGADLSWTNSITYEHIFGKHKVKALFATEMLKNYLNMSMNGSKNNTLFGDPDYAYIDNTEAPGSVNDINVGGRDWAAQGGGLLSYIGRISYNYLEKYIFDATIRYDGSSNFARGKRWGTFPSFSAGWNFSEENFMENMTLLDYGKLRASWGQNGNQSINNFIYSSNIAYAFPGYFFGDTKPTSGNTAIPANVPNPDVTWEKSEQTNIGLDARFLNSRLSFTFDWYQKVTKDWLVIAPVQGTAGAGAPWINGGDIENSGIELSLGWNDKIAEFQYGGTLSAAYNKNKVTRIANSEGIINGAGHVLSQNTASISRVEVGKPIGYFYGLKTAGILQNQTDVDNYVTPEGKPYFEDQRPGDIRFIDQNKDGIIDDKDKVMLGNPTPDLEMGLQLNAKWKGIYADVTLTGKFGQQVMRSYRSFADRFDQNYTTEIFGRWHGEGTSNRLPRLSSTSHRNTNLISDIYMHDADYVRINNLTIGYDFEKQIKKLNWIQGARVYVAFNNLYTFTKYDGMDPEVGFGHNNGWASGIDLGLYPLPRTVMFGLNVTF